MIVTVLWSETDGTMEVMASDIITHDDKSTSTATVVFKTRDSETLDDLRRELETRMKGLYVKDPKPEEKKK